MAKAIIIAIIEYLFRPRCQLAAQEVTEPFVGITGECGVQSKATTPTPMSAFGGKADKTRNRHAMATARQ
jgi:hypothetical protein